VEDPDTDPKITEIGETINGGTLEGGHLIRGACPREHPDHLTRMGEPIHETATKETYVSNE
jgi:hypothetical protein